MFRQYMSLSEMLPEMGIKFRVWPRVRAPSTCVLKQLSDRAGPALWQPRCRSQESHTLRADGHVGLAKCIKLQ